MTFFSISERLRILTAGVAGKTFLSTLKLQPRSIFVGAFVYAFGSTLGGAYYNITSLKTICWLPLGLYFFERYYQQGRIRYLPALALAVGMSMIAGYLQVAALTWFIFAAYVFFLVQRFTLSVPTYHIAIALPLLALLTIPMQLASPHAGAALLAIALLYLTMQRSTRNALTLYLGVLALNGAIYLWIPLWARQFDLFQLYIMPAAVSVLALLQMHRREIRPAVLNGTRLAALSTLYAGAALDVFVSGDFGLFVLALGLSLLGIVLGIALRIRAFLYAGVAFLIVNVIGQLLQFYPEQRLGRAIVLMGLGIAITGGMIGFNMKREAILRRVRIMRADLQQWE